MNDTKPLSLWKRIAIRSFFGGVGFATTLAIIAGAALWYSGRPERPKPWNTTAIVSSDTPGFELGDPVQESGVTLPTIELHYSLSNNTEMDYSVDSEDQLKLMPRTEDGSLGYDALSDPVIGRSGNHEMISVPVFIPAKQKAMVTVRIAQTGLPSPLKDESAEDFHERLRGFLAGATISGFVIFDDVHHYQINLPKWATKKPAH